MSRFKNASNLFDTRHRRPHARCDATIDRPGGRPLDGFDFSSGLCWLPFARVRSCAAAFTDGADPHARGRGRGRRIWIAAGA